MSSLVSHPVHLPEADLFRCPHCQDTFRREDHLRRHELSHGFPRFQCMHDGCGMRFHRRDVLQRHKLVHQHDPTKRRRRPRRGILPRIQQGPSDGEMQSQQTGPSSPPPPAPSETTMSISAAPEMFGLAEEWNLGLEDWPNYSWLSDNYKTHSWQGYVVPLFGSAHMNAHPASTDYHGYQPVLTSTIPNLTIPAMAPTFAPMPQTALATAPQFPMNAQELQRCLVTFTKTYLPRLPFIHPLTCQQISLYSPLGLSMASVGALRVDEHRDKAMELHEKAIEVDQLTRNTGEITLQNLQARVLLVEVAAWHGSEETLAWAIREEHVLCQCIIDYLKTTLPHLSKDDWASWRQAEELKRTVFAFFVTSVWITAFHNRATPLLTQFIDFTLPCPESLWEAQSAADWSAQMQLLALEEIHFPTAVHSILSRDTIEFTDYEMATIFGQQILLSAILDALNTAVSLPVNYESVAGWQARDMTAFRPQLRLMFEGAMGLWVELWWAAPEWLWDSQLPAHPRVECILLHYYTTLKLYKPPHLNALRTEEDLVYKPVRAAIEVFCSISKAGWEDIAKYAARLLHASSYHAGIACARIMLPWLSCIQDPSYGPLNPRDQGLLTKTRQAVRRRDRELLRLSQSGPSSSGSGSVSGSAPASVSHSSSGASADAAAFMAEGRDGGSVGGGGGSATGGFEFEYGGGGRKMSTRSASLGSDDGRDLEGLARRVGELWDLVLGGRHWREIEEIERQP